MRIVDRPRVILTFQGLVCLKKTKKKKEKLMIAVTNNFKGKRMQHLSQAKDTALRPLTYIRLTLRLNNATFVFYDRSWFHFAIFSACHTRNVKAHLKKRAHRAIVALRFMLYKHAVRHHVWKCIEAELIWQCQYFSSFLTRNGSKWQLASCIPQA